MNASNVIDRLRHSDRQTYRQTGRHSDRQAGTLTETDRHTNRQEADLPKVISLEGEDETRWCPGALVVTTEQLLILALNLS